MTWDTPEWRTERCAWSEEAAHVLAASTKWFPLATVEDYRLLLLNNPNDAALYRVSAGGELIGFVILKIERFSGGSEGVIVAAAGSLPGGDLVDIVLPTLQNEFMGVDSYRVTTARPGLVRKLVKRGWLQTHAVLRKVAP